ncbi:MAG: hypothetical protein LQ340_004410, partial [Diploschistes diacapsis]
MRPYPPPSSLRSNPNLLPKSHSLGLKSQNPPTKKKPTLNKNPPTNPPTDALTLLALDNAKHHIRVNSVCPSFVDTPPASTFATSTATRTSATTPPSTISTATKLTKSITPPYLRDRNNNTHHHHHHHHSNGHSNGLLRTDELGYPIGEKKGGSSNSSPQSEARLGMLAMMENNRLASVEEVADYV